MNFFFIGCFFFFCRLFPGNIESLTSWSRAIDEKYNFAAIWWIHAVSSCLGLYDWSPNIATTQAFRPVKSINHGFDEKPSVELQQHHQLQLRPPHITSHFKELHNSRHHKRSISANPNRAPALSSPYSNHSRLPLPPTLSTDPPPTLSLINYASRGYSFLSVCKQPFVLLGTKCKNWTVFSGILWYSYFLSTYIKKLWKLLDTCWRVKIFQQILWKMTNMCSKFILYATSGSKSCPGRGAQQRKTVCLITLSLTEFLNQTLWIGLCSNDVIFEEACKKNTWKIWFWPVNLTFLWTKWTEYAQYWQIYQLPNFHNMFL